MLGNRSNAWGVGITSGFMAFTGFFCLMKKPSSLWSVLVPFFFVTLPFIHYLARTVCELSDRVRELEMKQEA